MKKLFSFDYTPPPTTITFFLVAGNIKDLVLVCHCMITKIIDNLLGIEEVHHTSLNSVAPDKGLVGATQLSYRQAMMLRVQAEIPYFAEISENPNSGRRRS